MEIERENIRWDLVVSHDAFLESPKVQKDSLFFNAEAKEVSSSEAASESIRKNLAGPRKIRICLSNEGKKDF